MQSELLGYEPKGKRLKPGAIPSMNLPLDFPASTSAINRRNRMEAKTLKLVKYKYKF